MNMNNGHPLPQLGSDDSSLCYVDKLFRYDDSSLCYDDTSLCYDDA